MVLLMLKTIFFIITMLPLEGDEVLTRETGKIENGSHTIQFCLSELKNNFFLNIEELPSFRVYLNDSFLSEFKNQNRVTLDISRMKKFLNAGINKIEIKSWMENKNFSYYFWQSNFNWYFGTFHIHTTYSDGVHSVSELLNLVNSEGGNFCAITDHDTLGQCYDTAFHRTGNCEPIRGTEWTTDSGHANVLGPEGANTFFHGSIPKMIDDATYRGGLVHIIHPCDDELGMGWDRYPLLDPGIDAIEIFNNFTWFPEKSRRSDPEAVEWWQQLLCAGKRIAGAGSSDYHGNIPGENPLKSHSAVYARSDHPDTILKALKLGRVMACDEMGDSRLYIYADTNNNNIMDLIMGENVKINTGSRTIKFRLEVDDADALDRVLVFSREGEIYSHTIIFGGDYEYEWQRTFTPRDTNFMRVELRSVTGDYEYCTNPIYVNYPDYEFGPCDFVMRPSFPETVYTGIDTTVRFNLRNAGLVSPYKFGMLAAVDTMDFDITSWQISGPGIGEVIHIPNLTGYEIIEWRGGYPYSVRRSPRDSVTYWLRIKAKREGYRRIYYRSWADDRLFGIEKEPSTGFFGIGGEYWKTDSIYVKPSGNIKEISRPYINSPLLLCQPNPAKDKLKILLSEEQIKSGEFTLKIYDVKGSCIKEFPVKRSPILNLDGIKSGIYFIVLKTKSEVVIKKIVAVH
ncbi:MAG: CehA/McbA family metallohydrolase [candidate division WOR-3 bacterium]|nr:CehA/McbA family metallohydrolase [candidate division WOR-3 bacterium]